MTRLAAQLRTTEDRDQKDAIRDRFLGHAYKLRELNGLGEGEFPRVPVEVSRVSWYAERLDSIPYEGLEAESERAAAENDWPAVELLCLEMERRQDIGATRPDEMAEDESERWQALLDDPELVARLDHLDPITHPEARTMTPTSRREREQMLRVEYETWVETQLLDAETACRGHVFNQSGRNAAARAVTEGRAPVSLRALWTNHVLASAYASDELREWWEAHPRRSFTSWCTMMQGQPAGHAGTTTSTLQARRKKPAHAW